MFTGDMIEECWIAARKSTLKSSAIWLDDSIEVGPWVACNLCSLGASCISENLAGRADI